MGRDLDSQRSAAKLWVHLLRRISPSLPPQVHLWNRALQRRGWAAGNPGKVRNARIVWAPRSGFSIRRIEPRPGSILKSLKTILYLRGKNLTGVIDAFFCVGCKTYFALLGALNVSRVHEACLTWEPYNLNSHCRVCYLFAVSLTGSRCLWRQSTSSSSWRCSSRCTRLNLCPSFTHRYVKCSLLSFTHAWG